MSLQCQINTNLVFHISEDGSEIELKHCASSKSSVKSSRKYFVHLNWIRLATNPSCLSKRIFRCSLLCQINMNLVFHISEDGFKIEVNNDFL